MSKWELRTKKSDDDGCRSQTLLFKSVQEDNVRLISIGRM